MTSNSVLDLRTGFDANSDLDLRSRFDVQSRPGPRTGFDANSDLDLRIQTCRSDFGTQIQT